MLPGKCVWKPLVQLAVTGQARRCRLTNREPNWPASLRSPGLYLHVPFCRNLCPYCPYHRIEYTDPCFDLHERAVRQEIDLYAPRLTGLDQLRGLSGPTLIMPNHPGYIDPPLVLSHLCLGQPVRPVVRTTMYRLPFLYPLMRLIHALEVPDLSEQSLAARERTVAMIDAVVAGLEGGERFLIYPAGRTQRSGVEVIGGNRAVADILARCPQANIVLVRTRGLWGSMFTRARTGESPEFGKRLLQGFGWLLANLFMFSPRRDVVMTVELLKADSGPALRRETFNPFLEEWYNREGPESPRFIPYHRWFGPRAVVFPNLAQTLARHSDVRLTLGVYTHVDLPDQTAAIAALPAPPSG